MLESHYIQLSSSMRQFSKGRYGWCFSIIILNLFLGGLGVYLMCNTNLFLIAIGVFLLAFQMNHAYLIMHESGHLAFFKDVRLNLIIGNIAAFLCLYPNEIKKNEHTGHHRFTGGFDEPVAKKAIHSFSLASPIVDKIMHICWRLWIPIFTANELVTTWKSAIKDSKKSTRWIAFISLAVYLTLALLAFSITGGVLFLIKFTCAVYIYMMFLEFFTMPHHVPSVIDYRYGSVPFYEQDKYTQSCTPLPGQLSLLLMLNFNFHVAHHLYPYVHFTRLKEAHKMIGEIYPELLQTQTEWAIMTEIRKRSFSVVFKKYYPTNVIENSNVKNVIVT